MTLTAANRLMILATVVLVGGCSEPEPRVVVTVEAAPASLLLFGRPVDFAVRIRNISSTTVFLDRCDTAVPAYIDTRDGNTWVETGSVATRCLAICAMVGINLAPGAEYLSPLAGVGEQTPRRVRVPFGLRSDVRYSEAAVSDQF